MSPAALAIIGLAVLSIIGTGAVVALEVLRPEGVNTNATYTIIGIITPTIAVLLSWLKSVTNGQQIAEVKADIKSAPAELKQAAEDAKHTIKDEAERAATDLKQTASALAREKR